MKKFLPAMIIVLLITLVLNHASNTLNKRGEGMYASYLRDCEPKTANLHKSSLLGLTDEVTVTGWNCVGSDSGGQGYHARIWTHVFWLL
mgnify:CR=1 FL=1